MRQGVATGALVALAAISLLTATTAVTAQAGEDGPGSGSSADVAALAETDLQGMIDRLPDVVGETDAEHLRSLLGLPDAFTLAFEPQPDGATSRREQWFYYDLSTVFEFVDGALLWNLPLDAETDILLNAARYDPALFEDWMTWRNVRTKLPNPFSFEELPLDAEYGVPATIQVGDQIVLAFDGEGAIFYVETVPLALADAP